MKLGTPVRTLISIDDVCRKGDVGKVWQEAYGGVEDIVLVAFDEPSFGQNNFPFYTSEIEEVK